MQDLLRIAVAVVASTALAVPATAGAVTNGGGNSGSAPGQAKALENCIANIGKQEANGVSAGGGPKEGIPAPTNCDHYYQNTGLIGGP